MMQFAFHVIFHVTKYWLFFFFSNHIKNVKLIFSFQALQTQARAESCPCLLMTGLWERVHTFLTLWGPSKLGTDTALVPNNSLLPSRPPSLTLNDPPGHHCLCPCQSQLPTSAWQTLPYALIWSDVTLHQRSICACPLSH